MNDESQTLCTGTMYLYTGGHTLASGHLLITEPFNVCLTRVKLKCIEYIREIFASKFGSKFYNTRHFFIISHQTSIT